MGMTSETPPPATLLLRNLIASLLLYTFKSLLFFAHKYQLLDTFRAAFLFFLRFLPSSFLDCVVSVPRDKYDAPAPRNDTGIGRALSQLLSIMNDVPVSSRKYEVVLCLAESVIDENYREGTHPLRSLNRDVLSAAFARTLSRLESAMGDGVVESGGPGLGRVLRTVLDVVRGGGGDGNRNGISSGEKLAAESLWLARKLVACDCGEEAVRMWANASNFGWLALSALPRLQPSLLKLAAFLLKEAKEMGLDETEGSKTEPRMQLKLNMLLSWMPLLCRASNGTDAPVLSTNERIELERVLEEIIEGMEQEEKERVLSLWLHHFTHCPSSDWPNLHACYARWCSASRKQLLLQ